MFGAQTLHTTVLARLFLCFLVSAMPSSGTVAADFFLTAQNYFIGGVSPAALNILLAERPAVATATSAGSGAVAGDCSGVSSAASTSGLHKRRRDGLDLTPRPSYNFHACYTAQCFESVGVIRRALMPAIASDVTPDGERREVERRRSDEVRVNSAAHEAVDGCINNSVAGEPRRRQHAMLLANTMPPRRPYRQPVQSGSSWSSHNHQGWHICGAASGAPCGMRHARAYAT